LATSKPSLPDIFSSTFPSYTSGNDNEQIITIGIADIPNDLNKIRDCRSTVDFAQNDRLLASQKSFLNATSLTKSTNSTKSRNTMICIVAKTKRGVIVGTTDCRIGKDTITVTNVYVRPDQRGKGIGEKMMTDGVDKLVLNKNTKNNIDDDGGVITCTKLPTKVSLDVYTNNKPAVRLYQKCGYQLSDPLNAFVYLLSTFTGANLQVTMTLSRKT
jgi:ribosomal protein S18 acetylase RimI-like enzyme